MTDRSGLLPHSPLVYVLASVRFAPWPLLAKKIDEIHDQLREIVPLIHSIQTQSIIHFGLPLPAENHISAWMMTSADRNLGIQMSNDQLLFITRRYERYADFEAVIDKTLTVLIKEMRFIDALNVGVRYIDLIKPKAGDKIDDYVGDFLLAKNITGFSKKGSVINLFYLIEDIELRINSVSNPDTLPIPNDLIPIVAVLNNPTSPLKIEPLKHNEMVLDIDSIKSFDNPKRLEKQDILNQLKNLHCKANEFFRNDEVCKDNAFSVWKSGGLS